MATEQELVIIKLGLAADEVDAGMRRVKAQVETAGEAITHKLEGSRMSATAFKNSLHEIANFSPILSTGLVAIFNPVTAALLAAAAALKLFHDGIKERAKDRKELALSMAEFDKAAEAPIVTAKNADKARANIDREAREDRHRATKEENELNDPIEAKMKNLRREEEQYDASGDAVGKLAAQRKLLAEMDAKATEARQPVDSYNSASGESDRKRTLTNKEEAEALIKSNEERIVEQRKIQDKFREAAEKQRNIDEGNSSMPNIKKAMNLGDDILQEKALRYKMAVEAEEAYRRSIEETEQAIPRYNQQLSDGKAKHAEELTELKKVQAAHETLAQSVARTQKEVEKKKLEEGKAKIENETQTAANEIERRHSEGEIGPVQAAIEFHNLKVSQAAKERELEEKVLQDRLAEQEKQKESLQGFGPLYRQMGLDDLAARSEGKVKDLTTAIQETEKALKKLEETPLEVVSEKDVESARRAAKKMLESEKHALERGYNQEMKPYLPTLNEIANSAPWQRDVGFEFQKQQDQIRLRMGMGAGQRMAGDAQDILRTKDDLKRAVMVEEGGMNSDRAREDKAKIDRLQAGLVKSGLATSDMLLEEMEKHMKKIADLGSDAGLKIQPVNAE